MTRLYTSERNHFGSGWIVKGPGLDFAVFSSDPNLDYLDAIYSAGRDSVTNDWKEKYAVRDAKKSLYKEGISVRCEYSATEYQITIITHLLKGYEGSYKNFNKLSVAETGYTQEQCDLIHFLAKTWMQEAKDNFDMNEHCQIDFH